MSCITMWQFSDNLLGIYGVFFSKPPGVIKITPTCKICHVFYKSIARLDSAVVS